MPRLEVIRKDMAILRLCGELSMEPELTPQETALLKILADEWTQSGPPGFVETSVIAKALKLTIPEAKSIIHTLFVKGLVGTDKIDIYAAYLTPEGFDAVQTKA